MELNPEERLDDLQYKNLYIIQDPNKYCFGTDAILLAGFVRAYAKTRLLDIGCGTGILSILVNGRTGATVTAIDIQAEMADMAARSAVYNKQSNITALQMDLREAPLKLGLGSFDAAVCNPPYFNSGEVSPNPNRAVSAHQLACTIEDVVLASSKLIKYGGNLFICYPANQLAVAINTLMQHKLMPKRLCLVADNALTAPWLALIEAKKGGAAGLIMEPQLNVRDEQGNYTPRAKTIYHKED